MNCINHPTVAAVAQCADCSKGLCPDCANTYKLILCTPCYNQRKKADIINNTYRLVLYIVLFIVGYRLNFMASKGSPDTYILSGYIIMAILSGYVFVNNIIRWEMLVGTGVMWMIYYLFKLFLYAFVGFFTAPFTIGWTTFKLIRAIRK